MDHSNGYDCAMCRKHFLPAWTDEEGRAEQRENFPECPISEDDAVVCDDCYRKIMPRTALL
jgi:DNA-directed RNA polymerase subunit RPC12/RpoP